MKKHTRFLSLLLALAMCLSLATPAFAWTAPATRSNSQMFALLSAPTPSTGVIPPETADQALYWRDSYMYINQFWEGSKSVEETLKEIKALSQSLTQGIHSETEKARAIFDWVTSNITYGTPGKEYFNHSDGLSTYYFREGQCDGYTKLSNLMLAYAGLTAARIIGNDGGPHGWSAVYADGRWLIFDATWNEWDISQNFHPIVSSISVPYGSVLVKIGNIADGEITAEAMNGYAYPSDLVFPDCVTAVKAATSFFEDCSNLTSIAFPDKLTSIGDDCFEFCPKLTSVTFPNSLTSIGKDCFDYCDVLTSVTIPSVTEIGAYAFWPNSSMTSVSLPKNLSNLGKGALCEGKSLIEIQVDQDNPVYTSVDGVLFTRSGTLVRCPGGKEGAYVVPQGTTAIEGEAFRGCKKLTDIVLPDGLTSLGAAAFWGFEGNLTVPDSVTSISIEVFSQAGCDIYFKGTKEQWEAIAPGVNRSNQTLKMHYNSTGPDTEPQTSSVVPSKPTETPKPADWQQKVSEEIRQLVMTDPSLSDWARDGVGEAFVHGLAPTLFIGGYNRRITREEFCGLMVQLVEQVSTYSIDSYTKLRGLTYQMPFVDTQNSMVGYAATLGIVGGRGAGIFAPEDDISRQEAAVMLMRTAQVLGLTPGEKLDFRDTQNLESWAKEGVDFVSGLVVPSTGSRVMNGTGNGTFSPFETYTREQAILTALALFKCAK